ncbi:MAG: 2-oxoglutarate dehydrogenase complex dihydrolipoyllysine-residue succinyltransferase [Rickettsiales bacterium]
MPININVPPLGESVSEATIAKWHKKPGDAVKADELLAELETEKVTLEVNAPQSGVISELKVKEGDSVEVGALIATMEAGEGKTVPAKQESAPKKEEMHTSSSEQKTVYSPAAQKIAAEKGVYPESGTGKDGRVTKGDVLSHQPAAPAKREEGPREERVRMTKLRQKIAQRLKESQNTAAILTTFNEIDMSAAMKLRKIYQDKFVEKYGVKLGFMSFFTKAAIHALRDIPAVNAEIQGDEIVYKKYCHIGVAVGAPQGLVVPVLKDAQDMSFAQIEQTIAEFGKKARAGKLSPDDMSGGTFTISNGGVYGSLLSTPIINPPQTGILGLHKIQDRPVAENGQVVIRPMMYVALSYDHRLIDGSEAVTFLVKVKEAMEDPQRLLFDI